MGQKKKTGVSPKTIKWIWYAAFAPFALVALMLVLTVFGVFGRMPSFEELENPRSNLATEIYSEDGKVIGTFFVHREKQQHFEQFVVVEGVHAEFMKLVEHSAAVPAMQIVRHVRRLLSPFCRKM